MNTTVLHVFNFKCLMFQIEHRQGVEPVFAFNICCIALNASLCSSLEHVLAFKMCSMKNICVQVLHTGSVQYYRTRSRCSISVALLVFKLCSIPEHMFLNTCKRSVPSDQLVFFLVKPFSTWCSNSVLSPITLWCSILQNTFKAFNICCDFGVQMVFLTLTPIFTVLYSIYFAFSGKIPYEQQLIQAKILYQCPSRNILDFVYGGSHFSTGSFFYVSDT